MSAPAQPTGGGFRRVSSSSFWVDAITFLATTAAVVVLTFSVVDDLAPVARTLHTFEVKDAGASSLKYPHAYPTLDWISHPQLSESGDAIVSAVQSTTCTQDNRATDEVKNIPCAPEYWQRSKFCPKKGETYASWQGWIVNGEHNSGPTVPSAAEALDIEKQLVETEKKYGATVCGSSSDTLCWATPTLYDACRIERIGDYATMPNDGTSWGLASGHNSDLLYMGVALILWLISGFHLINKTYPLTAKHSADGEFYIQQHFQKQKNMKYGLGLLAFIFILLLRSFFVTSTKTEDSTIYAHILPNGSYFYILLSIFWVTVFGSNDNVFCQMQQRRKPKPDNRVAPEPTEGKIQYSMEGQPLNSARDFDVSAFSNGKKIDAYLPRLAPTATDPQSATMNNYSPNVVVRAEDFELDNDSSVLMNSCVKFEIAQLFILPLLLLATATRYNLWELDGKLQVLFLSGFAFSLFDVCKNRIVYSSSVFDAVLGHADETPQNINLPGDNDILNADGTGYMQQRSKFIAESVRGAVSIIELLCVVLQGLLFIVVWLTYLSHFAGRRNAVLLSVDNGRERHMDWSIWGLLVYFVLTFVFKLLQIRGRYKKGTSGMFFKFLYGKQPIYYIFCVFILYTLFSAIFIRENSIFDEGRNEVRKRFFDILKTNTIQYETYGKWVNAWVPMSTGVSV